MLKISLLSRSSSVIAFCQVCQLRSTVPNYRRYHWYRLIYLSPFKLGAQHMAAAFALSSSRSWPAGPAARRGSWGSWGSRCEGCEEWQLPVPAPWLRYDSLRRCVKTMFWRFFVKRWWKWRSAKTSKSSHNDIAKWYKMILNDIKWCYRCHAAQLVYSAIASFAHIFCRQPRRVASLNPEDLHWSNRNPTCRTTLSDIYNTDIIWQYTECWSSKEPVWGKYMKISSIFKHIESSKTIFESSANLNHFDIFWWFHVGFSHWAAGPNDNAANGWWGTLAADHADHSPLCAPQLLGWWHSTV